MSTIPLKVGWFGEQGTGKTTSAALLAAALSKQFHNSAPVWVTDPELGWQFPKRRIFGTEGVELVQRTVPTFKAMMEDLRAAEKAGACCYAVELAKPWKELLHTVQSRCGDRWGQELVKLWDEWVMAFLNSPLHCLALARVSDITEDVLNENGDMRRVKVSEGMKAGGQRNNFGYEPHLVLRMSLERKPRRKNGKVLEDEGRMVHRCDVIKDRTWELNGKVFRWSDRDAYPMGGYRTVWESLKPHFEETQATMAQPILDAQASSATLVSDEGRSAFTKARLGRDNLLADFKALFASLFGGQSAEAKNLQLKMRRALTGMISETRIENELSDEDLEFATLALCAMEERVRDEFKGKLPTTENEQQALLNLAIKDVDTPRGTKSQSVIEYLLQYHPPKKPVAMGAD